MWSQGFTQSENLQSKGPARPTEGELIHEVLTQGGLTVETRDADGAVAFRTVVQLDGDILFSIRRASVEGPARDTPIDQSRAEAHLAEVATQVAALGAALLRLSDRAQFWMKRVRIATRVGALSSGAGTLTAWVTDMRGSIGIAVAATVATSAASRWGWRWLLRVLLRRLRSWTAVHGKRSVASRTQLSPSSARRSSR